jgi:hypothetical protein
MQIFYHATIITQCSLPTMLVMQSILPLDRVGESDKPAMDQFLSLEDVTSRV